MLTRKRSTHRTSVITISDLKIDTGSHSVIRGARPIELSSREYAILELSLIHILLNDFHDSVPVGRIQYPVIHPQVQVKGGGNPIFISSPEHADDG